MNFEMCSIGPDFPEYWAAWQLILKGCNPYDATLLWAAESAISPHMPEPLMMWCPPWAAVIMGPILSLDYCHARLLWFCVSISAAILTWIISFKAIWPDREVPSSYLICALFFPPLFNSLQLGQIDVLGMLGVSLLAYGLRVQKAWLQGVGLVLLSTKPHLYLLVGWLLLVESFVKREFRPWIWAVGILILLSAIGEALSPGITMGWVYAVLNPPLNAPPPSIWRTATLVGALRGYFLEPSGWISQLIMWLVPTIPMVVLTTYHGRLRTVRWDVPTMCTVFAPLVPVSYITAPFGWLHDQVAFAFSYCSILAVLWTKPLWTLSTRILFGSLLMCQLLTSGWLMQNSSQHESFWYPFLLGVFLLVVVHFASNPSLNKSLIPAR